MVDDTTYPDSASPIATIAALWIAGAVSGVATAVAVKTFSASPDPTGGLVYRLVVSAAARAPPAVPPAVVALAAGGAVGTAVDAA